MISALENACLIQVMCVKLERGAFFRDSRWVYKHEVKSCRDRDFVLITVFKLLITADNDLVPRMCN